jgi:hypothetical protein
MEIAALNEFGLILFWLSYQSEGYWDETNTFPKILKKKEGCTGSLLFL